MSIYISRVRAAFAAAVLVLVFVVGYTSAPKMNPALPQISTPAPHVTTIEIPVPVLTEKIVTQYLQRPQDAAAIAAVLRENAGLKIRVEQLTVSLAEAKSTGQGTSVIESPPPAITVLAPPRTRMNFTDWRLNFTADGTDVRYVLSQKFSIVSTVGRNKKGVPTNLIELYEFGPDETRMPITTTDTKTIAVTASPRWHVTPAIQAGMGRITPTSLTVTRTVVAGVSQTQRGTDFATSAVFAIQWLKRGTDDSLGKTRWAVASPALSITSTDRAIGVLPVSFNVGSIRRQPFTNLWISPFVGTSGTAIIDRVGLIGSATF
jgi:hypothetical protein